MKLGVALSVAAVAVVGCGANPWTDADTSKMTHAVNLGKACEKYCLSDGGCAPEEAADCFHAMDLNVASCVYRHGGGDLLDGGAAKQP